MTSKTTAAGEAGAEQTASCPGPLHGVQIVTLTQAWAGTSATQLLSHLGADVIQIEARQRPDVWRGTYNALIPSRLKATPTAQHGWNVASAYNSVNLGKRGVTLDLGHPEGKRLFEILIRQADVTAENFSPRVMGNLGLSYEALCQIRPDLIMLSLSAYGTYGPYSAYPGICGTIEGMSGMSSLLGYEGGEPMNSGLMYPDPVAGYFGAAAVTLALLHRRRTGKGQHITLAMQEACANFVADAVVAYGTSGVVPSRRGNHHPRLAPHNIYPAAGDDAWIAIAAVNDEQFSALSAVLGLPADPRFASNDLRKANEPALDALVAGCTSACDAADLRRSLSAAGVPSEVVVSTEAVFDDPVLRGRGTFVRAEHAEAGVHRYPAGPWLLEGRTRELVRAAPCIGQHSREVLTSMCGLSDAEYDRLVELNVTGEGPPS